jgi:hypothetical protein
VDVLVARFQEHLDAMAEAARREIAWRVALQHEVELEKGIKNLMTRVQPFVAGTFGQGAAELREFGLKPYVRRKPSTATMKIAVEKRRATRARCVGPWAAGRRKRSKGLSPSVLNEEFVAHWGSRQAAKDAKIRAKEEMKGPLRPRRRMAECTGWPDGDGDRDSVGGSIRDRRLRSRDLMLSQVVASSTQRP